MGYTYHSSRKGIDLIIPTRKGIEEGNLPKGAIIPVGYKFIPEVMEYINSTNHKVYTAKHCDRTDIMTHIVPDGIVNRFGWYISSEEILSVKKNWSIDISDTGWFRRVTVEKIQEIEKYM